MPTVSPDRANPDALWRAVQDRDESRDGSFFYAVKTTGVYPVTKRSLLHRESEGRPA